MILEKFLGNSSKKVTTVGESGEIPHFCYLGDLSGPTTPALTSGYRSQVLRLGQLQTRGSGTSATKPSLKLPKNRKEIMYKIDGWGGPKIVYYRNYN